MSKNECLACPTPCCVNFKIRLELTDSEKVKQLLIKYPFIHKTGVDLTFVYGHEKIIGIYNCDRFNIETKQCLNYDSEERPEFCINTGIISKPHPDCILK